MGGLAAQSVDGLIQGRIRIVGGKRGLTLGLQGVCDSSEGGWVYAMVGKKIQKIIAIVVIRLVIGILLDGAHGIDQVSP